MHRNIISCKQKEKNKQHKSKTKGIDIMMIWIMVAMMRGGENEDKSQTKGWVDRGKQKEKGWGAKETWRLLET